MARGGKREREKREKRAARVGNDAPAAGKREAPAAVRRNTPPLPPRHRDGRTPPRLGGRSPPRPRDTYRGPPPPPRGRYDDRRPLPPPPGRFRDERPLRGAPPPPPRAPALRRRTPTPERRRKADDALRRRLSIVAARSGVPDPVADDEVARRGGMYVAPPTAARLDRATLVPHRLQVQVSRGPADEAAVDDLSMLVFEDTTLRDLVENTRRYYASAASIGATTTMTLPDWMASGDGVATITVRRKADDSTVLAGAVKVNVVDRAEDAKLLAFKYIALSRRDDVSRLGDTVLIRPAASEEAAAPAAEAGGDDVRDA